MSVKAGISPISIRISQNEEYKKAAIEKARKKIRLIPYSILVPGGVVTVDSISNDDQGRPWNTLQIARIRNGTFSIYFPGRLEFYDIFDQPQWITFCVYISNFGGEVRLLTCPYDIEKISYQRETKQNQRYPVTAPFIPHLTRRCVKYVTAPIRINSKSNTAPSISSNLRSSRLVCLFKTTTT